METLAFLAYQALLELDNSLLQRLLPTAVHHQHKHGDLVAMVTACSSCHDDTTGIVSSQYNSLQFSLLCMSVCMYGGASS